MITLAAGRSSVPPGQLAETRERGLRVTLSDDEFALFRELIEDEIGVHLGPSKKPLLVSRLVRRLRDLGLTSFGEYYRHVVEVDPGERQELLNRICTNETHFFREPKQFEFLERRLVDEWLEQAAQGRRPRKLRVWSAACSSGEEPYSLAMALVGRLPAASGWEVDILATDVSTRMLQRASAALWPIAKSAEIPQQHLKSFMLEGQGAQAGWMKAGPLIRSSVRFRRLNLNGDSPAPGGPFDLILCRNVLIYFGKATRLKVLRRLLQQLTPEGYLFLGHAESLAALPGAARSVGPAIYTAGPPRARATR